MLFRVFWAGQTIFSRGVLTILINKLVTAGFGPQGLATYGYWQNFLFLTNNLSNGSSHNGIVLVASRSKDPARLAILIKECFLGARYFILTTALLIGLVAWLMPFPEGSDPSGILPWVLLFLPIVCTATNLSNIASGRQQHVLVGLSQLALSLFSLLGVWVAMRTGSLSTAVIFLSLSFLPQLLMLLWHYRHAIAESVRAPRDRAVARELWHHGLAHMVILASFPLAHYLIRGHLITTLGGREAGMWEACLRIGGIVVAFTSFLNLTYFLPSIKGGEGKHNLRLMLKFNAIQIPILVGLALCPFVPGLNLTTLLFSAEFARLEGVLPLIALMEAVRGNQYFLTYVVIGTARFKYLVAAEIFFSVSLWASVLAGLITPTVTALLGWYACVYLCNAIAHFIYLRTRRHL